MTTKAIAALFPSRTIGAVMRQINVLACDSHQYGKTMPSRSHRIWSPDEINLLQKLRADGFGPFRLRAYFPDRSIGSIQSVAKEHGLAAKYCRGQGDRWSQEDDSRLAELVKSMNKIAVAQALGRTIASVQKRAESLGVTFLPRFKEYTAEEILVILRMRRDKVPYKQIARELGREAHAVRAAYFRHRPLREGDAKVKKVSHPVLSREEMESVSTLRKQEVSWVEIGRRYPMHSLESIMADHRRLVGSKLTPTEVREIESLRDEGKLWREIARLDRFYPRTAGALTNAYRRARENQK
jgi:hypothetical protein